MSYLCCLCSEGALSTQGRRGVNSSLSFEAATFCQPVNVSTPLSVPQEQGLTSSLPCCCYMALVVVMDKRLVIAHSVYFSEYSDLFPYSILNRSISHLFSVSSLSSCLFCLSNGCCWHEAPVGAGGDQVVLPGVPAPNISSFPAKSQYTGEGIMKLPHCFLP